MQDFFAETDPLSETHDEFQQVEINLLIDFWKELKTEIDTRQWGDEQGLRYLLAAGLAALRNQRLSESQSQNKHALPAVVQKIQNDLINLYGRYAAIRHYAGELKLTNTNLEVQLKASKAQLEILRKVNVNLLDGMLSQR